MNKNIHRTACCHFQRPAMVYWT